MNDDAPMPLRLAWVHVGSFDQGRVTDPSDPLDHSAALVAHLATTHAVERFDERRAHDLVWMHARGRFDLCVFELADTSSHAFVWPYLLNYPGVLYLRASSLRASRATALYRSGRAVDYTAEVLFSRRELLYAPLLASRLVVVGDPYLARRLADEFPDARIRYAPIGVAGPPAIEHPPEGGHRTSTVFGVMPPTQTEVVRAAAERARLAGAPLDVMAGALPDRVLRESDVVLAMEWPPSGEPPAAALAAMAAGKPVIAFETETSAGWPALDPQTWRVRGHAPDAPIAVTVDPRDHEHSLVLAMRRLAGDSALRSQLGAAARAWWQAHATVQQSATAWHALLAEALTLAPPARPQGWPAHLSADGTERARALVKGLGVSVDFLHSDTRAD